MRKLVAKLSGLALVLSGTGATARTLPNYDAILDVKPAARQRADFTPVNGDASINVAHRDEATGAPRFLWALPEKGGAKSSLSAGFASMAPEKAALAQLASHATLYGLSSFEAAGAKVTAISQSARGVKVIMLSQESSGIEVFRQGLRILLDRNNTLVAVSGSLSPEVAELAPAKKGGAERFVFRVPATSAIATAYHDLTGVPLEGGLLRPVAGFKTSDRYTHYELASLARPLDDGLLIPARAKQVLYPLGQTLVPAYYLELNTGREDSVDSDYYSYVVSAVDGRLLMRKNLTSHAAFSYRVFADTTAPYTPYDGPAGSTATPHPVGAPTGFVPPFVAPSLVTLQNAPFSQNDPWLAADATETRGNNVDAYADLVAPDNYNTGDIRPAVTAPGVFDRTFRFDLQPNGNADQIAAAATSLFFVNNWLHDWFYDSGFDEASGNAQASNFGRGGLEGDALRAQAQDYSGINNANMQTPADGASPRMQMYLFNGPRNAHLTVNAPSPVAGQYRTGVAAGFGPQLFDVTGDLVLALDADESPDPTTTTTDGCSPLTNAAEVAGKVALIDRGNCNFTVKVQNAQVAGAIGVVIADNQPGYVTDLGGSATGISIPSLRITLADGNKLRAATGLNVRLFRGTTTAVDGTLDNAIVAHEWGHYISNRLIWDSSGLVNNQGGSMGEGWGDFHALLTMARAEDVNVPGNENWNGAYSAGEYATRGISPDSTFFGIRRVTYSSDMAKNALTFRHIADSAALPTTAPIAPGGVNSEVHNSGEVWATMLWECYTALLRAHPFEEAQSRMKEYLVNGYKLTPFAPTFLEARDAIIAAARAADPDDALLLWGAFAKRGAGVGAVAPPYTSTNHEGVVESFFTGTSIELVSAVIRDDLVATSCDRDGFLDNGETGRILVTIRNNGATPAAHASVTVLSTTRGVQLGNGGSARFPVLPEYGYQATVEIPVTLSGAAPMSVANFQIAIRDDEQGQPGDQTSSLSVLTQVDERPQSSKTEDVQTTPGNLPWFVYADPTLYEHYFGVVRFADGNRAFYGEDVGAPSDTSLITPVLEVSATEPLVLSFRHAHDFEYYDNPATGLREHYDGAVIEITEDGANWVDIGASLYGGTLENYAGNLNPLAGQRAIVDTTPGFPALVPATLDLGMAYAGKQVMIRFRIGTDNAAAATGWLLDDLTFSGIDNSPFTSFQGDDNVCVNRPPVADAGPDLSANERSAVTVHGSATDADNDPLTFSWTRVSGPDVTLENANTASVSFSAPDVTSDTDLVLRLTVSDGAESASDTVTVRIWNVNRAPTVNAGLDGSADERQTVTLNGSASDADGDALTFLWTQVSGIPVAMLGYDTPTASFVAPEVAFDQTLTFRLTVSDGVASVSDTVDVVVHQVNRAPSVTASSVTVDERSIATLRATGTDPDGDALTYAWKQTSGRPVALSGANTATATFRTGEVSADAVLTFRVTVSDGSLSASQSVTVNIRQVNVAPTVNAGADRVAEERTRVTLHGAARDADGDALTYTWVQTAGRPVALSGAHSLTPTFTTPKTRSGETLTFRLTVSDGSATVSDSVNVIVRSDRCERRGPHCW
ncbi:myxosortase-dependent M36 family metallopeptidase [Myxococcus stipitatus]|uniref:myxosortase-dependent M36 family metallopeptidase n=1 Tax=Myxococcus stipitatus TaxID=83455 RepID=UPI002DD446B8|nr:myxosortase-dependent M36 family metallopeptidase [Myxococcus stipitatus]